MGKKRGSGDVVRAPGALDQQLQSDKVASSSKRDKAARKRHKGEEKFLDSEATKRVLSQAKRQMAEEEDESDEENASKKRKPRTISLVAEEGVGLAPSDEDSDLDQDDVEYEPPDVDEEEAAALEKFMSSEPVVRRTLADIIQEKIREKELQADFSLTGEAGREAALVADIPEPVVEMYRGVRDVLKTYRSGRLPKAFKMIPMLRNWEQVLQLTEPEGWSSAAMYQATRIFASNLSAKLCQRFLNLVLLPRVRDDIAEFGKLNFHLYQALKKALFKPAAFFKGILIPLCEEGTCTLREATIIGSVLAKCSIPMLHVAAAMLMIAEMDYSGANSLFLRLLIDKAYTLPYRVLDALVAHFLRFSLDQREMTVLWHQSLLSFVQRYKADLSTEQRDSILDLLKVHQHHQITPEIQRELSHVKPRDVEDGSTMEME